MSESSLHHRAGAAAFSALGCSRHRVSPQQIGLMFGVIVAPMIVFGCAYIVQGLSAVPVINTRCS